MAADEKPVVAELGRPETPEETASRRAAASAKRRANQTLFNLIVATIASLGIVLFLVVVVVRPDPGPRPGVDVAAVAAEAAGAAGAPLIVPALPDSWSANTAEYAPMDEVETWYVGYLTPDGQFIAFNQGIGANPTWLSARLDELDPTGDVVIGGLQWQLYDNRDDADPGNHAFAMSTQRGDTTIVLHGTAGDDQFQTLAIAVSAELEDE